MINILEYQMIIALSDILWVLSENIEKEEYIC